MRLGYFVLAAAFLGLPDASFAATAYSGACASPSPQITAEKATSFLDAPAALLANYADGGGALSSAIRDLVSTRPETLEGIQSLCEAKVTNECR